MICFANVKKLIASLICFRFGSHAKFWTKTFTSDKLKQKLHHMTNHKLAILTMAMELLQNETETETSYSSHVKILDRRLK